jgi:uncharacterized protein YkwD
VVRQVGPFGWFTIGRGNRIIPAVNKLLVICLLAALLPAPLPAKAAPLDFPVPGGHFFTQAASNDGTLGFAVLDDGSAQFWSEFQRLGGVAGVGYPISQRFTWDGFVVQAMQKGVLQWRPEVGRAYFVNVFDQLALAGKDDWLLSVRSTPRPLGSDFDGGRSWDEVVAGRLALLDANPAIKAVYFAVSDPLNLYGLPASRVVDNGDHYAIRLQRAVIQQWKVVVPWARAGQVTVANGGDVGKEAGLFPATVLMPALPDGQRPTTREGARPSPQQTALETVNYYRRMAGAAPLALDDALNNAAAAHANYYVLNYGDPQLAGMGLHRETVGRPGFTGVGWTERARAAGYGGSVDENIGLVANPQRAIDWFIDTINHRWNLIHPSAVHLGYGIAAQRPIDVFDIGFGASRPAIALPTVYPGDGQQGVAPFLNLYETPDPLPGIPRPVGYPVTISFHIRDSVSFGAYSLVDSGGQPVQLYTAQKSWLRSLALVPVRALRSGERYTATVSGTVNGQPFTKSWSFTTR